MASFLQELAKLQLEVEREDMSWRDDTFSDVKVQVGERTYKLHRIVLARGERQSKFFAAAWAGHFGEGDSGHVDLTELLPKPCHLHFEDYLDFTYGMDVKFTAENVLYLFKTADILQSKALFDAAVEGMRNVVRLSRQNALDVLLVALDMRIEPVIDAACRMLAQHFVRCLDDPRWCQLPTSAVRAVVHDPRLCVRTEDDVYSFILRFLESRAPQVSEAERDELWSACRFGWLSKENLRRCLRGDGGVPQRMLLVSMYMRITGDDELPNDEAKTALPKPSVHAGMPCCSNCSSDIVVPEAVVQPVVVGDSDPGSSVQSPTALLTPPGIEGAHATPGTMLSSLMAYDRRRVYATWEVMQSEGGFGPGTEFVVTGLSDFAPPTVSSSGGRIIFPGSGSARWAVPLGIGDDAKVRVIRYKGSAPTIGLAADGADLANIPWHDCPSGGFAGVELNQPSWGFSVDHKGLYGRGAWFGKAMQGGRPIPTDMRLDGHIIGIHILDAQTLEFKIDDETIGVITDELLGTSGDLYLTVCACCGDTEYEFKDS